MRPIIRRWLADRDVESALSYYLAEVPQAAPGFIDALEQAFDLIRRHPDAGSSRLAHELELPGLRSVPLARYPYVVFYHPRGEVIEVWRVLHMNRDIPEAFRDA